MGQRARNLRALQSVDDTVSSGAQLRKSPDGGKHASMDDVMSGGGKITGGAKVDVVNQDGSTPIGQKMTRGQMRKKKSMFNMEPPKMKFSLKKALGLKKADDESDEEPDLPPSPPPPEEKAPEPEKPKVEEKKEEVKKEEVKPAPKSKVPSRPIRLDQYHHRCHRCHRCQYRQHHRHEHHQHHYKYHQPQHHRQHHRTIRQDCDGEQHGEKARRDQDHGHDLRRRQVQRRPQEGSEEM